MKSKYYSAIFLSILSSSLAQATVVTQGGNSFSYVENQVSLTSHTPTPLISCTGAFKFITVDGNLSDWNNIPILIDDPVGDVPPNTPDVDWVKAANSKLKVFFAEKFASAFPLNSYTYLLLDTDENPKTGCQAYGIGFEYGITIGKNEHYIGDARDCSWSNDFEGLKVKFSLDGKFLEASVPITTLQTDSFDITTANDQSGIGCYVLQIPEPSPEPCLRSPCIP